MQKNGELDDTDMKILNLLRKDARLSYREIGKRINISTGTVSERVKQMQRVGVIKGFVTAVDPEKLGCNVTMLLELSIGHDTTLKKFDDHLAEMEEVCCIHHVTGELDMMVLARCNDQSHAVEFLDMLRTMENVASIKSHMVLKSFSLCGRCGCECNWDHSITED